MSLGWLAVLELPSRSADPHPSGNMWDDARKAGPDNHQEEKKNRAGRDTDHL
jgi:hypothetical protein